MVRIPDPFETSDRHNEWSVASVIKEWVNEIIKDHGWDLGPAEVEKSGPEGKRPDFLLYENPRSKQVILNIEFKIPAFDPWDEKELKEPARQKAVRRKSPYFGTSNFRKLIVFDTQKVNAMKREESQIVGIYDLSDLYDLDRIRDRTAQIKNNLERFLSDFVKISRRETEPERLPIDELLIHRLHEKIQALSAYYRELIEKAVQDNPKFRKELALWFNQQNWNFSYQPQDYERAARQAAYLLVNKILFYDVLQLSRRSELDPLGIPEDLRKGGLLQKTLQNHFDEVLKIDYETIYSTDFIDQVAFPEHEGVVYQIKELVNSLKRYRLNEIGFEVIGRIFERLIPPAERHALGQYFTNPDVVDIILRFALRHENDLVFDPGCGAGTFLVRAYQHKKFMNPRLTHEQVLPTLWGNDIAKFPAHLATINLAVNDLSSNENYPRIVQKDFFEWLPGKVQLPESSKRIFLKGLGEEAKEEVVPRFFDAVVGNPPYTRQEEIEAVSGSEHEYKERLIEQALYETPGHLKGRKIADISRRAGLHAYFFVHGMKFLKDGGRFGFVVSNSWLDVDYGKGLQKFFLENYKIAAIIESKVERWFPDAGINTCVVLLEKTKDKKERDENLVRFGYLKKPLSQFIPPAQNIWEFQKQRLEEIDKLFQTVFAHNTVYQNDDLRIFPKKQSELWEEGWDEETQSYEGSKWGKYLRAPDIFFTILEKGKDKLVPLKEIANVRFGIKTGANEFFYLTEEQIKKKGIEKEFWMHKEVDKWVPNYVITSPRECKAIAIKPGDLQNRVLMIQKDKKDLGGTKVLDYIKEGERAGFHKRPTTTNRKRWYDIGTQKPADILWFKAFNDRVVAPSNEPFYSSDRFYSIYLNNHQQKESLVLSLNSTIQHLFVELWGRVNLGAGALDNMTYEAASMLVVRPDLLDKKVASSLDKFTEREILPIFSELGAEVPKKIELTNVREDRRDLDKQVMGKILGLTEEEQLEVYRSVIDLIKSRLERAQSVESQQTSSGGGPNIDLMVETILKRIEGPTLGEFYQRNIAVREDLEEIHLPEHTGSSKIEKTLMAYRLTSGKKWVECGTEEEARYLQVFLDASWDTVSKPKNIAFIKEALPQLEKIYAETKKALDYYTEGILDQNLRNQIARTVWQK